MKRFIRVYGSGSVRHPGFHESRIENENKPKKNRKTESKNGSDNGHTQTVIFFYCDQFCLPTSWSSANAFVSGAGGLRFKSWAGQIRRSAANAATFLRKGLCCPGAMTRRWALQTRYMYEERFDVVWNHFFSVF